MKRGKGSHLGDVHSNYCSSHNHRDETLTQANREISKRHLREAYRLKDRLEKKVIHHLHVSSPTASFPSEEAEYLNTECRTSKIDGHLITLRKLREKALRYTNQLDEIREATKRREKELTDVMDRLQEEEKNLHHKLEQIDHLSYKMSMKKNQLRQDQATLQKEEDAMSERLQELKEKEIFINCQMVKLQSQEAAIRQRKRDLQRESLRIEKLAHLIFKTDLSATTYKEFNYRLNRMQLKLERRYRKLKVLEHYCQHKSLPAGIKLEPITPINHNLDPALAAFEDLLWKTSRRDYYRINSRTSVVPTRLPNSLKTDSSSFSDFRRTKQLHPVTGKEISEYECSIYSSNMTSLMLRNPAEDHRSNVKPKNSSNQTTTVSESGSEIPKDDKKEFSTIPVTATKKSKSEQEGQIVKQASSHLQRLVMSAKETFASTYRLLQTPVPALGNHCENGQMDDENIHVIMTGKNCGGDCHSNPDPDSFLTDENGNGNPCDSATSDVYSIPGSTPCSGEDVENEKFNEPTSPRHSKTSQPGVHGRGRLSKDSARDSNSQSISSGSCVLEDKDLESIYQGGTMMGDKISSQLLMQPERNGSCVPFKYRWKEGSDPSLPYDIEADRSPESRGKLLVHNAMPPDIVSKESTKKSIRKLDCNGRTGHDGDNDRLTVNYDAVVQEQLSKLTTNTRNEILYVIGQRALSQVAQAIGKASDQLDIQCSQPADATSNESRSQKRQGGATKCQDSYLATIRRGVKSPKKGPRRIPSHLKFGNFNIRRRNKNKSNPFRHEISCKAEPSLQNHKADVDFPVKIHSSQTGSRTAEIEEEYIGECSSQAKFPECNHTVDIIAEKILGIYNSSSIYGRKDNSIKLNSKASHTRAFRV